MTTVEAEVVSGAPKGGDSKPKATPRARPRQSAISEARNWFKEMKGAVLVESRTLGHPIVERLYHRHYEKMSQYLHFIPVYGRALIKNEEDVAKVEAHVHNTISNAIKSIDGMIREANALRAKNNIEEVARFNGAESLAVPMTSHSARVYFDMLSRADEFLRLNSTLWICGALADEQADNERIRSSNELKLKRILGGVNFGIVNQQRTILNRLRKNRAAENADDHGGGDATLPVDAGASVSDGAGVSPVQSTGSAIEMASALA